VDSSNPLADFGGVSVESLGQKLGFLLVVLVSLNKQRHLIYVRSYGYSCRQEVCKWFRPPVVWGANQTFRIRDLPDATEPLLAENPARRFTDFLAARVQQVDSRKICDWMTGHRLRSGAGLPRFPHRAAWSHLSPPYPHAAIPGNQLVKSPWTPRLATSESLNWSVTSSFPTLLKICIFDVAFDTDSNLASLIWDFTCTPAGTTG